MSRFKNEERVMVTGTHSGYLHRYGTVVETDTASVRVRVDGVDRVLRFWDTELISAPHVPAPGKELLRTLKYLKELDEDTQLLFNAVDLYPRGTTLRADLEAFANHQAKIVGLLKGTLEQDGVTLWKDEDGGE